MIKEGNTPDNYEHIMVKLDPSLHPIAYVNRVKSLVGSGMNEQEAKTIANEWIEIEIYYDPECGLFGLEAEAVDSIDEFCNPYTGDKIKTRE